MFYKSLKKFLTKGQKDVGPINVLTQECAPL